MHASLSDRTSHAGDLPVELDNAMTRLPGDGPHNDYLNQIITGDARELSSSIPSDSIDIIFTDPPYPQAYLYLYEWLGKEAARVLKPGGFLFAYCGQYHFDKIMGYLSEHLDYYWLCASPNLYQATAVISRGMAASFKPIVMFTKGHIKKPPAYMVLDMFREVKDKRFHAWGQGEMTARYYIESYTQPCDVILEPFCGGGTVPYVCKQIRRNYIAFEIDPATADIARKRLEVTQPLLMADEHIDQLALIEAGSEAVA